jgi:hypothetical protein
LASRIPLVFVVKLVQHRSPLVKAMNLALLRALIERALDALLSG